ncbi:MAG: hypothetical protein ACP5RT_00345 [Candidatus Micrarchaeia archaeon]
MLEDKFEEFAKFVSDEKGKRKFKQSVELAINFKGIDFSKQDNKLNVEVMLPYGKGKVGKAAIFTNDRNLVSKAKDMGVEVIDGNQINTITSDKVKMNSLLNYDLLAQPSLMPEIAKKLGQFLGPRNKMPKPVFTADELEKFVSGISKRINIKSKGRFLPTVHCVVGSEDMKAEELYENIKEVVNVISKKVSANHLRSVYVKLSMSKPLKLL